MKEEIAIPKRGQVSGRTRFGSGGPSPTCAGMERESLGLESSSTTPVCPRDIANSMAVSPMRFGGYWGQHPLVLIASLLPPHVRSLQATRVVSDHTKRL